MSDEAPAHDANAILLRLAYGHMASQVAAALVELGVPDALGDPGDASEVAVLAETLGVDRDRLDRLLRAACTLELAVADGAGRYAATEAGARLRRDARGSLAPTVRFLTSDHVQATWNALAESVRTGETAVRLLFGVDSVFSIYATDPEIGALFDLAMTANSTAFGKAVAEAYDFGAAGVCIDVGGGEGRLLTSILEAHPAPRGVVFDVPPVAAKARRFLVGVGLASRCDVVEGDMFAAIPGGGDIYLMSAVIHDWDDERSRAILENCRKAMPKGARLLLIERVISETPKARLSDQLDAMSDLNMMVRTGGRERSGAEFRALLAAAGFEVLREISTRTGRDIIEAAPLKAVD